MTFPYYWRVSTRLPEYKGLPCRVLIRGRMNSCLVEFEDGQMFVTSRNFVRKRPTCPRCGDAHTVLQCPLMGEHWAEEKAERELFDMED